MPSERPGDDVSQDVLIHADPEEVAHKHLDEIAHVEDAYWRVNGEPRRTEPWCRIWFEDDGRIHAWGIITDVEDGRIWFDGARSTDLPCPVDAPTRGFKYVDSLTPRLSESQCLSSGLR